MISRSVSAPTAERSRRHQSKLDALGLGAGLAVRVCLQGIVSRLEARALADQPVEDLVDGREDRAMAAEIPGEGERQAVLFLYHLADALERLDIGAPERED